MTRLWIIDNVVMLVMRSVIAQRVYSRLNVVHCGDRTFVPISWMRKKQIAGSDSLTGAKRISVDAGWQMERLPDPNMWECVTDVIAPSDVKSDLCKVYSHFEPPNGSHLT